ncbi:MAG: hypothetical protein ABT940_09935, partial [Alphaproteobacteria bacterium]
PCHQQKTECKHGCKIGECGNCELAGEQNTEEWEWLVNELRHAVTECDTQPVRIIKRIEGIIDERLSCQKDEMKEMIEKMKTDERKVAMFGEWQAETYEEHRRSRNPPP